jgi:ATP dependent DNA ligase domain
MPKYIWPPHPATVMKIVPQQLPNYEADGLHVAQLKFQGSRASVQVKSDSVNLFGRHGESFRAYNMPSALADLFRQLSSIEGKEIWLDGELLHLKAKSKVSGKQEQTNTIVLFDVLYYGGFLLNTTQVDRIDLLSSICNHPTGMEARGYARIVGTKGDCSLWMAETFFDHFLDRYQQFDKRDDRGNNLHPLIEGLMLRRRRWCLPKGLAKYDVSDMIRCRRPTDVRNF